MEAEFHFFPLLPWELREKIWKLVIRPTGPGANVFRVYNRKQSEPVMEDEAFTDDFNDWGWHLAAPQCLPNGVDFSPAARRAAPISWTLNNPSTYLVDSGLWTACKESMLIIEQEFQTPARRQKQWTPSEVESFRAERGRFTLPETATYMISDPSRYRYITVFPTQDLLILQIRELPTPHFLQNSHDVIALNDHFLSFIFPSLLSPVGNDTKTYYRHQYDLHVAFEYDPAWDTVNHHLPDFPSYGSRLLENMIKSTASEGQFSFVWFIDYRIKRNPRHQAATGENAVGLDSEQSKVFFASDRRFVEVKEGQLGGEAGHEKLWDTGYETSTEEEDFCYCCGSEAFINLLDDKLELKYDDEADSCTGGGPIYDLERISYGLLACECF
jgi:hypothetical protein